MVAHPKATQTKRYRERAKAEKRKEKALRREARKNTKEAEVLPGDMTDPDLAGIQPGPQPPQY